MAKEAEEKASAPSGGLNVPPDGRSPRAERAGQEVGELALDGAVL